MRKANAKGAPGTHTYGTPSDCIGRAITAECRGNECQYRPPLTVTVTVTVPVIGYWLLVTGYWLLVYWFTGLLVYWLLLLIRGLGQPGASVAVEWWLHGRWSPPGLDSKTCLAQQPWSLLLLLLLLPLLLLLLLLLLSLLLVLL